MTWWFLFFSNFVSEIFALIPGLTGLQCNTGFADGDFGDQREE